MNEYAKVVKLCTEVIPFFERKPDKSSNVLQVFYYSLLMKHLNLQEYARCRQIVSQYRNIFPTGHYNWFKWQELHLLAELHAGRYEQAAELWQQVTTRPEYAMLPHSGNVFWKISEAYLYFLSCGGQLKGGKADKKFRIDKMLNEIRLVQRDKSGMMIPVLVIGFLLALSEKEYDRCSDGQESLAKYRSRHLGLQGATRSHYFFRMMELLPKTAFQRTEVAKKALPLLRKLREVPLEAANQHYEVEIMPYETLWALTIGLLEKPAKVLQDT